LLEPQPIPLAALAVTPEGPPARFRLRGRQHEIVGSWGPERIQTGWWRGEHIRRDYYRVETAGGQRFWLFRSRDRWFLHGVFD
jgi:protein ImuB